MPQRLRPLALWGLAAGLLLGVALSIALPTWASRNSAGTYSLPPGNPVIPGTPISSTWANSTLADIANELTSSLDRQGRGAMAAPLQLQTGTAIAPALTFSGDTNTGLYRAGTDSVGLTTGGGAVQTWTLTGTSIAGRLSVAGSAPATSLVTLRNTSATGFTNIDFVSSDDVQRLALGYANASAAVFPGAVVALLGADMVFANGATQRVRIASTGLTIGDIGTAISGSYGGTFNLDHGTVGAGACVAAAPVTLNGVALGGVCNVSSSPHPFTLPACSVTAANAVRVSLCNVSTVPQTLGFTDYHVRVFQP